MKLKHATVYLPLILSAIASANAATVIRSSTADNQISISIMLVVIMPL
jgi:hypothetical protein